MPERHLLPIPLPHGRTGDTGHLSVFMSPRLLDRGELRDYPEWMRWPDFVNFTNFQVRIDGNVVSSTVVSAAPDLALWNATFLPGTPVRAHRFEDWTQVDLVDVPTSSMHDALLELYTDMAIAYPTTPPDGDGLSTIPSSSLVTDDGGVLDETLDALAPMDAVGDLEVLDEPRDPMWDFHRYLSLLGSHPELLRQLGLVVDLEVKLPASPSSVTVRTTYQAQFGGSGAVEIPVAMHTTKEFLEQPNPNGAYREQDDGFLILDGAFASIFDTAGSAARLAGLATHAGDGALPALSTRALTLVRPDQSKALALRLRRQAELEEEVVGFLAGGPPPAAFAEDVSRGHRVDVLDLTEQDADGPTWRSLFERTSADGYQFPDAPILDRATPDDEGWAQLLLSTELAEELPEPNPDNHDAIVRTAPHRVTEALYRWDNWSGAVPRPSNSVDAAGELVPPDDGLPLPDDQPVRFAVNYQARPGSLPRLRCTHPYQMRARAVDLSGWSPAVTEKSPDDVDTDVEVFGRLEPITSPTVVRRDARPTPGVGDMATTVVLLSDYDIDDADVPEQERLLFPGAIGHDLSELHGLPDGGADPGSYSTLVKRSAASPEDDWDSDETTGEPIAGGPVRHELDYLVDPMVGAVRAEHFGERAVYSVEATGDWPELTSVRIVAVAGQGATEVNPDADTDLRVHVEKADVTGLDLSYAPADGMLEHFGLWHRFSETEQEELRDGIAEGAHWMFSSRERLSLVHAVRRPLSAPDTVALTVDDRAADSTAITFKAVVAADRRSTGSLAVRASWTDLVDDPSRRTPRPRPATTLLGRFDTPRDSSATSFDITSHRSDLGDTRRHAAIVEVEAYSAFSHYFTEERSVTVELGTRIELDARGVVTNSAVVIDTDGHRVQPRTDFLINGRAGTIRFPVSTVVTPGEIVTVQYVPLPVSRTSDEHGPGFEILIPNTAVPPRPIVIEAAPAFARSGNDTIEHDGRVIRIHVDRPWNLTGDGERLAVLVSTTDSAGTRIARDPIVSDRSSVSQPDVADFTLASSTTTSDDGRFELAIHDVVFDEALGHWIVDIAIDTPLYRPFVRLAVARYQPDSIDGRHLGPSVMLDPIRLGVHRHVKHAVSDKTHALTVAGIDHDGKPSTADDAMNEVGVRLQHADPTIEDADLRWITDVDSVTLTRAAGPSETEWTGSIEVASAGVPQRLVIEEFEPALLRGDPATTTSQIVYTEIIDIDA